MQQRVSFARALVVNPDILLLDEPFSQLDVLTAETLRNDLLDLWVERRIPTKGILIVSHNIEEAVDMADRILIFSSDPGGISAELTVRLPHPRSPDSPAFRQIVDQVYTLLTTVPGRDGRPGHRAPAARFLRELEDHLSEEEAERVLDTVINWGRHAEIFAYDDDDRVLSLENF